MGWGLGGEESEGWRLEEERRRAFALIGIFFFLLPLANLYFDPPDGASELGQNKCMTIFKEGRKKGDLDCNRRCEEF